MKDIILGVALLMFAGALMQNCCVMESRVRRLERGRQMEQSHHEALRSLDQLRFVVPKPKVTAELIFAVV